MKKKLNNLLNLALCFVLICGMFLPLRVLADGELVYNFHGSDGFELTALASGNQIQVKKGEYQSNISFATGNDQVIVSGINITCANNDCTVAISGQSSVKIPYSSNDFALNIIPQSGEPYKYNVEALNHGERFDVADNFGGGQHNQIDGKAVLVWSCGNKICYHEFTNLMSDEVNYIKASDAKDDRDQSISFDVHASEKFFAVKKEFDKRKAEIDANSVRINDLKGPEGIDYMPVGEPTENNALVSYGDREFKAIVYGSDFKGVSIGDLNDLDYYPSSWNDWFLRRETYDMSGTTKENPVEIDTVLLQKKINLKLQTNLNNYSITKIEALDVPSDAVKITKKNDGSYDFEFASNYYDKVIFKITTSDNKEQYIYINRRTTDPWIRTNGNKTGIVVETFYDRAKSYSDLDVIAKIVSKDGSSKVVHLSAEKGIDDGLGNIFDDYEIDEQTFGDQNRPKGKGMKRANFVYAMSKEDLKKVDKIYINVEFKGSTSTTFAGNFVGSGKGDIIEMKYWEDRLN